MWFRAEWVKDDTGWLSQISLFLNGSLQVPSASGQHHSAGWGKHAEIEDHETKAMLVYNLKDISGAWVVTGLKLTWRWISQISIFLDGSLQVLGASGQHLGDQSLVGQGFTLVIQLEGKRSRNRASEKEFCVGIRYHKLNNIYTLHKKKVSKFCDFLIKHGLWFNCFFKCWHTQPLLFRCAYYVLQLICIYRH